MNRWAVRPQIGLTYLDIIGRIAGILPYKDMIRVNAIRPSAGYKSGRLASRPYSNYFGSATFPTYANT